MHTRLYLFFCCLTGDDALTCFNWSVSSNHPVKCFHTTNKPYHSSDWSGPRPSGLDQILVLWPGLWLRQLSHLLWNCTWKTPSLLFLFYEAPVTFQSVEFNLLHLHLLSRLARLVFRCCTACNMHITKCTAANCLWCSVSVQKNACHRSPSWCYSFPHTGS